MHMIEDCFQVLLLLPSKYQPCTIFTQLLPWFSASIISFLDCDLPFSHHSLRQAITHLFHYFLNPVVLPLKFFIGPLLSTRWSEKIAHRLPWPTYMTQLFSHHPPPSFSLPFSSFPPSLPLLLYPFLPSFVYSFQKYVIGSHYMLGTVYDLNTLQWKSLIFLSV